MKDIIVFLANPKHFGIYSLRYFNAPLLCTVVWFILPTFSHPTEENEVRTMVDPNSKNDRKLQELMKVFLFDLPFKNFYIATSPNNLD